MNSKAESPRYILILGSLFLLAYAAYNLGIAWMDSVPENSTAFDVATQSSTPTITPTASVTPTNVPLYWITPTAKLGGSTASQTSTATVVETTSEEENANTTLLAEPTSTGLPTPTATTGNAYPLPEMSPTATVLVPTATSIDNAYPGPEATATTDPGSGGTQNPYPGPGDTPIPTIDPNDPYPGPATLTATPIQTATSTPGSGQPTPTQTPSPTPQNTANTPTNTLPASTPLPLITTLTYSETLVVSNGAVYQAVWSRDGNSLAMATSKGLYQYDAQKLEKQTVFDAGASILSAKFAFNNSILIAGGGDAMIRWWNLETEGYLGSLPGHLLGVARLDLPNSGNFLASGSDDATVRVWDVLTAFNQGIDSIRLLHTFRDPVARVMDMDASANGEMIAAASQRNVHIWQPQSGVLLKNISQPEGWYSALAFSPDSQTLTTAFDGQRLEFWNTSNWQRVKFINLVASVQALAYSPDGNYLAVGYTDGRIQLWEVSTKSLRADLAGHEGLTNLAFAPFNNHLVTSSNDGTVRIWDVSPLYGVD